VRVWAWVGAIAAAAAALYASTLAQLPPVLSEPRLPWWGLAIVFVLAESYPVHLEFRRETHTLSLSELGLVIGLFLAAPGGLLLGFVCGATVALVLVRRQRPLKIIFNLAQFVVGTECAILVFRAIAGLGNPHGPLAWAAAGAAAVVFGLVTVILVTVTIALASGISPLRDLARTTAFALVASLASASLGVAAVELLVADARSVWLLGVLIVWWGVAFRAYGLQRRRHEDLEFLYRTMRATQGAPELRASIRELLSSARAMLSAEYAEIVLFGSTDDEPAVRSVLSADAEQLMQPAALTDSAAAAARAAVEREHAILLARGRKPNSLDPYLAERGLHDAIVTPLRHDQTTFGLLLVGNRAGEVSTFNSDDRKLFETFASHAGVLLENDRVKEQLRYQAFHDALTALPNRTLFSERVTAALECEDGSATVLFIDLDDFKTINDTLGHSAGDELLVAVAERVRACLRRGDIAARLGGDEFGIVLDAADEEAAADIAARLVDAMRTPFVLHGRETTVHASIGIANATGGVRTAEELLMQADIAMYTAKADGARTYAVYEPRMHTPIRRRHELVAGLEHALARDEIRVHYQPIVALAEGRTVALEALVRWQHPVHGLLAPGAFLELAEERGLITDIGRFVLRDACGTVARWREAHPGGETLGVAVNLSPSELLSAELHADVADTLRLTGLPPEALMIEITESSAMADPDAALASLHELRRLGVRLALDDFGTGYSSLSHLRDFPLDTLKIAKPFVDRLGHGPGNPTFVDAILRLATTLGLDVVAEGIERAEQANLLRRLECGLGQGFHFARPLGADDAEAHLLRTLRPPRPRDGIRAA
jgi:diguanylate cyclase (GGDEF)-like protein